MKRTPPVPARWVIGERLRSPAASRRPAPGARSSNSATRTRRPLARAVLRLLALSVIVVLPFGLLLRGSVWLYSSGRLGTWAALLAAAGATSLLLGLYAFFLLRRLPLRSTAGGRAGGRGVDAPRITGRRLVQVAAVIVCAYCGYGLLYLSSDHAKGDAVRSEYRALHPLLRLAVSTLVLVDGQALITDASRTPGDYGAMGLPEKAASLHYRQPTGWAHAVDLRTRGRSALRNALVRGYFASLGFRTLRHGGTADHLHVSLPTP